MYGGRLKAIKAAVVLFLSRKEYLALKKVRTKLGKLCVYKGIKYISEHIYRPDSSLVTHLQAECPGRYPAY